MEREKFIRAMQCYVAKIAITGSTLRNQGAKEVVKKARDFVSKLDLSILLEMVPEDYAKQLDRWTGMLRRALPRGAQNWGAARKAINVFMVHAFLNKYLAQEYGLHRFGHVLETPLDSKAAQALKKLAKPVRLPRWDSIKCLTPESSQRYQEFASQFAAQHDIPRACLDTVLWSKPDA